MRKMDTSNGNVPDENTMNKYKTEKKQKNWHIHSVMFTLIIILLTVHSDVTFLPGCT